MKKQRLDLLLAERKLVESRSKAQAMIMAGDVEVDGQKALKAGEMVPADVTIVIKQQPKYVSRGGDKLDSVAGFLNLDFLNKTVLDVGSSTGGFTDFALQNGARKVYAVDVGSGQLHYRLRKDERVVVVERTDIRDAVLPALVDMAVIDVSFISLIKVLPAVAPLVKPEGIMLVMAKPQFEASKAIADKYKGVIADQNLRLQILSGLEAQIKDLGFNIISSSDSKVKGPKGNRERFYVARCSK